MAKKITQDLDIQNPDTKNSIGFLKEPIKPAKPKLSKSLKIAIIVSILLIISMASIGAVFWWYTSSFTRAAGVTIDEITTQIKSGLNKSVPTENGRTNFLVLGLDEIIGQKDGSQLTDTILIASYKHDDKKLTMISLPRDLWIGPLKTKINALYYYGQLSEQTSGKDLTSTVVSQILGLPIHYTIILGLDSVEHIVNTIGGVDIEVSESFTDTRFPKKDVDVKTVTDESLLYETVSFEKGTEHMDGARVLKYIRSRSSQNIDQGNDNARGHRQQQLIMAIIARISTREVLSDPNILGSLYKIYHQNFSDSIQLQDLIALAKNNGASAPSVDSLSIPIEGNNQPGLIFHPPTEKYKQWVYEPTDPSWSEINTFINKNL